jgi:hypothetical protein
MWAPLARLDKTCAIIWRQFHEQPDRLLACAPLKLRRQRDRLFRQRLFIW